MNYEITEEQIKELCELTGFESKINNKLKKMFPEVFETKFEVGKWYKHHCGSLMNFQGHGKSVYGFSVYHENFINEDWEINCSYNDWVLATDSEVEEALINEAKKRGFVIGSYFINFHGAIQKINDYPYLEPTGHLHVRSPRCEWEKDNCNSNPIIFENGVWAKIVKTYTKEEAEKLLNAKII